MKTRVCLKYFVNDCGCLLKNKQTKGFRQASFFIKITKFLPKSLPKLLAKIILFLLFKLASSFNWPWVLIWTRALARNFPQKLGTYLPNCWKVFSVVPVFMNIGERSTEKNYHPASILSVVTKICTKLLNNKLVNHLQKSGFFLIFISVPMNQLQIF